jgi:hypothetical protein
MFLFDLFQFPHQAVVLGIGDFWLVKDIVTVVMIFDLFSEFLDPLF